MVDLAVVFVSYNAKYFLEEAIRAAFAAQGLLSMEVWVVDNASTDGSVAMIREVFPEVNLIANEKNVGFSAANNQAIRLSTAKYVLLLNPDTLVAEDTFKICVDFLNAKPVCGGLGVRMIDGSGRFLPESKRGLPTPEVAFYKIFGLSSLLKKSKRFGKYHLTYLDEKENHCVEVLSGAFMMLRSSALEKSGLLSEEYFMYGEDIDLSYCLQKAGYENWYVSNTTIIHFKGESTKRETWKYVKVFYQAMIIFANRHFSSTKANAFSVIIKVAVVIRAIIALFSRFTKRIAGPILDAATIFLGMWLIKEFWETKVKDFIVYPSIYTQVIVPIYISIWLLSAYINGAYDKPFRYKRLIRGILLGSIAISAIYGFMDESLRFSRAMILMGTIWSIFCLSLIRWVSSLLTFDTEDDIYRATNLAVIGSKSEADLAKGILKENMLNLHYKGFICNNFSDSNPDFLGNLSSLSETLKAVHANDTVLALQSLTYKQAIEIVDQNANKNMRFRFLPKHGNHIISSNHVNRKGDVLGAETQQNIVLPSNIRNKRNVDLFLGIVMVIFSPVFMLTRVNIGKWIANGLALLTGSKTAVGYIKPNSKLPFLKPRIVAHAQLGAVSEDIIAKADAIYARDFSIYDDINTTLKNWRKLGE